MSEPSDGRLPLIGIALERGDGREGRVPCIATAEDGAALAARLGEHSFTLRRWNNGTPDPGEED